MLWRLIGHQKRLLVEHQQRTPVVSVCSRSSSGQRVSLLPSNKQQQLHTQHHQQ